MKTLMMAAVLILSTLSAQAKSVVASTVCQQDEGDQWIEAAIVPAGEGLNLVVVYHNADSGYSSLVYSNAVSKVETLENGTTVYTDVEGGDLVSAPLNGSISTESDQVSGLKCYKDIQFHIP